MDTGDRVSSSRGRRGSALERDLQKQQRLNERLGVQGAPAHAAGVPDPIAPPEGKQSMGVRQKQGETPGTKKTHGESTDPLPMLPLSRVPTQAGGSPRGG